MNEKFLESLQLKNFRCFESKEFYFEKPTILIEGKNGSGKTSLLEALHYLCYLRSFRTHIPRDMARFGTEGFFIKALFNGQEIKVGCAGNKRHVKIDQKAVSSYQELRQAYRMVTITDDDLALVKEGPDQRRSFIDHALILYNPFLIATFQQYKQVLDNRNSLLYRGSSNTEELEVWTHKLWTLSQIIQHERIQFLNLLKNNLENPLSEHWSDRSLILDYAPKKTNTYGIWEEFYKTWSHSIVKEEYHTKRSIFGTHLDDITILFDAKPARLFSSRGQQKLIVLLIKIAQIRLLIEKQGGTTFLIDDFFSDFDKQTINKLMQTCHELKTQLIFTSPSQEGLETSTILSYDSQRITLDI